MISTTTYNPKTLLPIVETGLSNPVFSKDRGYYRSKIFNTTIGVNPLIAAASPLFSLAAFISENNTTVDAYTLYQDCQHEIKAFENSAKIQCYRSETILVTRFLLCAFLDEMTHSEYPLLKLFHQEDNGQEQFFLILERLIQDPEVHIDLLELIYLCLRFGFLGQYQQIPEGKEMVNHISQKLFHCIRHQRGELKKEVHIAAPTENCPPVTRIYMPVWLILSFTLAILLTIYSSFSYMLGNSAQTLYQQINSLMAQSQMNQK
jgi:type VI secretion system protein ImpK